MVGEFANNFAADGKIVPKPASFHFGWARLAINQNNSVCLEARKQVVLSSHLIKMWPWWSYCIVEDTNFKGNDAKKEIEHNDVQEGLGASGP